MMFCAIFTYSFHAKCVRLWSRFVPIGKPSSSSHAAQDGLRAALRGNSFRSIPHWEREVLRPHGAVQYIDFISREFKIRHVAHSDVACPACGGQN